MAEGSKGLCDGPAERAAGGGEGEAQVERGQDVAHQQDPGPDGLDQRHHEGHLLPAQDPRQPHRQDVHQGMVGDSAAVTVEAVSFCYVRVCLFK